MQNPYWHEEYKPHQVDRTDVRLICFEINNLVSASMSQRGDGEVLEDGEEKLDFSPLERLCYALAEAELSKRLLRLALLVRTYDETMSRYDVSGAYETHKKAVEVRHSGFGATFVGKDDITDTIRECCNKIIHADDVRPVYETDDDSDDPSARWGMEGTLELEGTQGKTEWKITIFMHSLLEGILDLIDYSDSEAETNTAPAEPA